MTTTTTTTTKAVYIHGDGAVWKMSRKAYAEYRAQSDAYAWLDYSKRLESVRCGVEWNYLPSSLPDAIGVDESGRLYSAKTGVVVVSYDDVDDLHAWDHS